MGTEVAAASGDGERSGTVEVVELGEIAEAGGGGFGGDVALRHGKQFVADHEFLHGGGAEKRRKVVRVEMPLGMRLGIGGRLMEAHGVWKGSFEEIVVADGDAAKNVGELRTLVERKIREGREMAAAEEHDFERPDGPVGDESDKSVILADDAGGVLEFELQIIAEQAFAVGGVIFALRGSFARGQVGNFTVGPDLAVRVRIAAADQLSTIFENFDVTDPGDGAELAMLGGPDVDDFAEVIDAHARDGEIVARRKADDAADATLGTGNDQAGVVDLSVSRTGEKGGIVVVENKRGGIGGIFGAASAGICGAKIAGRIVRDSGRHGGFGDLAEPGSLGTVRRDQHPFAEQRIPAAVRRFLESVRRHG